MFCPNCGNSRLGIIIKLIIGKFLSALGILCYFFAMIGVMAFINEGFQSYEIGLIFIFAFLGVILRLSAMIIRKKSKAFAPSNDTLSYFYTASANPVKTKIVHCPNCGADSTICDNIGECEYCGSPLSGEQVQLTADDTGQSIYPKPPFALKRVRWGVLEFENDSMSVWVKLPKVPHIDVHIPYNEIFGVSYVPATKWLNGFLCVREWKDRYIPLPRKFSEMTLRNVTTWLEERDNDDFLRIYEFLKQCAAINAEQRQK